MQPDEATPPAEKDPVASIGGQMPLLSTGERAALRRTFLTNSAQAQGVLIGLLHRAALPDAAWRSPAALQRWRLLAHVAATLSGTAAINPHAPGQRLGRALHAAGYSVNRLMRLTTARGPALIDQVVRAARYLAQAGQAPVDLRPIRALIGDDPDRAERARIDIARDYFAAEYAQGRDSQ
ncbi:CRISPR type I-E-associated protein CasB/Cse2 [Novosphingobium capsulatum]|uniref:CRISPR type I-E-associated protein CasB/Cse2 n=2 Tax=Novosphingobium TaxID=165696 RepID=A0ABU1MJH4_9SPHN|nr:MULTISPECIES: type I-E CRISPR-associated protein Cse2/CasB [Novosphingobium]KPF53346.1 hypothetical protein IP65_13120 [Novosphingobium sp. AAP1]MBB3358888.1 CRISPR type I-E-associated protein CasB/Cse2 [Novosphingobium sp. BK256]MBB3375631.1 CRISPR type I-E-associated protein CasB/Cse2 [Novosphingobium sp. BK280]MBB3379660.1 CRISPR type I-E-associated protein CasB/Cse2 [Novosphingobium sp. BK258]MBB3421355.1 CRISPR type I-E-associated protein CasB/Cse2 [Novosphingobium sp. BK267]